MKKSFRGRVTAKVRRIIVSIESLKVLLYVDGYDADHVDMLLNEIKKLLNSTKKGYLDRKTELKKIRGTDILQNLIEK